VNLSSQENEALLYCTIQAGWHKIGLAKMYTMRPILPPYQLFNVSQLSSNVSLN